MLSFAKKNPRAFINNNFELPCVFAIFKILGAIFSLAACTKIVLISDNVLDVVKDFAAVSVISQIDELLVMTVSNQSWVDNLQVHIR